MQYSSSSNEAVEYEAMIRFALKHMDVSSFSSFSRQEQLISLTRIITHYISDDVAARNPLLRAMREHVLLGLSAAAAASDGDKSSVVGIAQLQQTANDKDGVSLSRRPSDEKPGVIQAMRSNSSNSNIGPLNSCDLRTVALRSIDSFISVQVIGARAKTSAFLDRLIRDTQWSRVALVGGSTVAEACYLAINSWGIKKKLTVIDIGSEDRNENGYTGLYSSSSSSPFRIPTSSTTTGKAMAMRLATQTQATTAATATSVRYVPLSAAHTVMMQVDVVVMGAREICNNGNVIVAAGGSIVVQAAQDADVPVVVVAQSVKLTERCVADWFAFDTDGDVIKAREIQTVLTELDTASWRPTGIADIIKKLAPLQQKPSREA